MRRLAGRAGNSNLGSGWTGPIARRPASRTRARRRRALLAQSEPVDQLVVALGVFALQVREQPPPPVDELQEPPPGVVVLGVRLEVVGQVGDAVGQQRHLDLGRARVGAVGPEVLDERGLLGPKLSDVHLSSNSLHYSFLQTPSLSRPAPPLQTGGLSVREDDLGLH